MEDDKLRKDYIQTYFFQKQWLAQKRKEIAMQNSNKEWEIFEPVLKRIEELTPISLRKKVGEYFNFEREKEKGKFNLYDWMRESVFASFGMTLLGNSPFSKKEIERLNDAWGLFIGINPQYQSIHVASSEFSAKVKKDGFDNLMKIAREVQEERDFKS